MDLDLLGLAHPKWLLKNILPALPEDSTIGVFDDPFGPVLDKLKKLLDTGKVTAVRIHPHWSNMHEIAPIKKLKKKVPRYDILSHQYPGVKMYVSVGCEHNETNKQEILERVKVIQSIAPDCIPVNSIWKGAEVSGVITEHHTTEKVQAGEIVSLDGCAGGSGAFNVDIEAWKKKNKDALFRFLWAHRFNLREIADPGEPVPPPEQRTAAPSLEYFKSIVRLGEPIGTPKPWEGPEPVIPIEKPLLLKSHAEDSQSTTSLRENKPLALLKTPVPVVNVLTWNGISLGTMVGGGSFPGGLHRFYAGHQNGINMYGYEIEDKARQKSGNGWVYLRGGKRVWGPVNPAFRASYFID